MKDTLYEEIVSLLGLDSAQSYNVLDIGCGWGDFLGFFVRHDRLEVDASGYR